MDKKKKKILLISIICIVFATAAFVASMILINRSRIRNIAFYGLKEIQVEAITGQLERANSSDKSKLKFVYHTLDDKRPLISQRKNIDLLFTNAGLEADKLIERIPAIKKGTVFYKSSIIKNSSISAANYAMSTKNSDRNRISQVPVLFDGYEILLSIQSLSETRMEMITSWNDLEKFAESARHFTPTPIAFAGGDDDILLGFISAMVESFEGTKVYDELVARISESNTDLEKLAEQLWSNDGPLYTVMQRIERWKKKGLINLEILKMNQREVNTFAEKFRSAIIMMPLSQHREIDMHQTRKYTTIPVHTNESVFYFPAMRPLNTRALVSPVITMIPLSADGKLKTIAQTLITNDSQEELCNATGLSPLLANCRTPDIQSDDIRFWIAATSKPVVPIGYSAFSDKARKAEFAALVRNKIISMH